MGFPDKERQSVDDLCGRWGKDALYIIELARTGLLQLWIELFDVALASDKYRRKEIEGLHRLYTLTSGLKRFNHVEIKLNSIEFSRLQGNDGRAIKLPELSGYDIEGDAVTTSSLFGLQDMPKSYEISTSLLFAHLEEVKAFEEKNRLIPLTSVEKNKSEDLSTKPENVLAVKREKTLLKVIGVLLSMKYKGPKYYKGDGNVNANAMAQQFNIDLAGAGIKEDGIKEDTLRKNVIPEAMEAIKENLSN